MLAVLKEEKLIPKEATIKEIPFFKPKENGVSPDGYSGRIGIHEVLPVTHEVRELILKRVSADDIEIQAKREGMLTMVEDGIFKAVTGVTTIEEVLRVISE